MGVFPYEAPLGFVLARGPNGEVDFSTKGYIRYLNQMDLEPFYTDAFGRTFEIDRRQDIQLNRLQVILHGWLFDERFRYFWYAWTQNPSQGDPAQVVVGGNISYQFADWFNGQRPVSFRCLQRDPPLSHSRTGSGSTIARWQMNTSADRTYRDIWRRESLRISSIKSGPRRQSQRPWRQRQPVG